MPVTIADLENFHSFALARLNNGGAKSLPELISLWLAAREREEIDAAIREGLADIDAGRVQDFAESMAEFRAKHNLPPRPLAFHIVTTARAKRDRDDCFNFIAERSPEGAARGLPRSKMRSHCC